VRRYEVNKVPPEDDKAWSGGILPNEALRIRHPEEGSIARIEDWRSRVRETHNAVKAHQTAADEANRTQESAAQAARKC